MHVRERGERGKGGRGDFLKRCGMESGAAERSMLKSDSDARSYAFMLELVTSSWVNPTQPGVNR
jgi:hypothetical protein